MPHPEEYPPGSSAQKSAFKPVDSDQFQIGTRKYSLTLWKKEYLRHVRPAELNGEQMSAEEMLEKIRQQQSEIEYLKRQREILKKAMSILGEEPHSGMR